jgi:hypothetical protein
LLANSTSQDHRPMFTFPDTSNFIKNQQKTPIKLQTWNFITGSRTKNVYKFKRPWNASLQTVFPVLISFTFNWFERSGGFFPFYTKNWVGLCFSLTIFGDFHMRLCNDFSAIFTCDCAAIFRRWWTEVGGQFEMDCDFIFCCKKLCLFWFFKRG